VETSGNIIWKLGVFIFLGGKSYFVPCACYDSQGLNAEKNDKLLGFSCTLCHTCGTFACGF
jgi:hypothetical protein